MGDVIDMFPEPEVPTGVMVIGDKKYEFPLSDLEGYIDGKNELDPVLLKGIVAVFCDLAYEGVFSDGA